MMRKHSYLSFGIGILLTGCVHTSTDSPPHSMTASSCKVYSDITNTTLPVSDIVKQTRSLKEVSTKATALASTRPEKTLVVFDIDDTLLTNKPSSELASSAWVNWQEYLTFGGKEDSCRAAEGAGELYNIVSLLYATLDLQETELVASDILTELSESGIYTHALTSRSPLDQGATLRELDDNGLSFNAPPCSQGVCTRQGIIPHIEIEALAVDAFGCEALKNEAKLSSFSGKNTDCSVYRKPTSPYQSPTTFTHGREVSISNGVMLSEGQNKGVMLELLLRSFRTNQGVPITFDNVIFVDDSEKNIVNLHNAKSLNRSGTELSKVNLVLYHYDRNPERNKFLNDSDALTKSKMKLDALLCETDLLGQYGRARGSKC